ncbi:MAG TPA: outer membrane beta-barrel protein [Longimicrobium sp.]|jgi:hypothetical protein
MTSRFIPAALAALALALPAAARAQGCIGAPVPEGRLAAQLQGSSATYGGTPDVDGMGIGGALRFNPRGPFAASAEYGYSRVGDGDVPLHSGGVMLAFRAPVSAAGLSVCARAGAMAARLEGSASGSTLDNFTFPVGLVLELPVAVGTNGSALVPYVAPSYLFSSTEGEVLGFEYGRNGNGPGVEAGLGLRFGRAAIAAGGSYSDLPEELVTTAVSSQSFFLRVGLLF